MFFFLEGGWGGADYQRKQQNHTRISLSSDLRSEKRDQNALGCYFEGQNHEEIGD